MAAVNMLPNAKHAPRTLGRVLVLGLGKSGRATIDYLLGPAAGRKTGLYVAAGQPNADAEAFAEAARAAGAVVAFGDGAVAELAATAARDAGLTAGQPDAKVPFDLCVASPGISERSDLYRAAAAASREIVSEVELAWRESAADSRWVAVTGTNGKTTVTSLIAHILANAGLAARAVGNIGDPCIAAVAAGDTDVYVAEVSSYQLASTRGFAPNAAVLLGITPDHLSWHGSLEAYAQAKLKVLANLASVPGACAVLDATNDAVRAEARRLRALAPAERGFSYVPVGTGAGLGGDMRAACGSENAAFVDETDTLVVALDGAEEGLLPASHLRILGEHNRLNALAAAAAALSLDVSAERVAEGLATFAPLEHRIEPCGSVAGVTCYNDSKATNVDATLKALESFPGQRLFVLLGGRDKGTDLAPLVAAVGERAVGAVCFGEAGERFECALREGVASGQAPATLQVVRAAGLESALDAALSQARPGDVVLLSPACASFDEFSCFEERGEVFKALVAARAAAVGA